MIISKTVIKCSFLILKLRLSRKKACVPTLLSAILIWNVSAPGSDALYFWPPNPVPEDPALACRRLQDQHDICKKKCRTKAVVGLVIRTGPATEKTVNQGLQQFGSLKRPSVQSNRKKPVEPAGFLPVPYELDSF